MSFLHLVQSSIDGSFWAKLGNLKLDKLRLSEDPQQITGEACSGKVSPCGVLVILFGTEQHFLFSSCPFSGFCSAANHADIPGSLMVDDRSFETPAPARQVTTILSLPPAHVSRIVGQYMPNHKTAFAHIPHVTTPSFQDTHHAVWAHMDTHAHTACTHGLQRGFAMQAAVFWQDLYKGCSFCGSPSPLLAD